MKKCDLDASTEQTEVNVNLSCREWRYSLCAQSSADACEPVEWCEGKLL
jgi:hypothetical protein